MCLLGCKHWTRSAPGKASSMIKMGVRQHDGRRRYGVQQVQPVRSTIDHDTCRIALNKQ